MNDEKTLTQLPLEEWAARSADAQPVQPSAEPQKPTVGLVEGRSLKTHICEYCNNPFPHRRDNSQNRYCNRKCYELDRFDPVRNFWRQVNKAGIDDCWIWTGLKDKDGYGRFTVQSVTGRSSRFSWELHNGPIPDGQFALHKCDNPPCVNPHHLFLGTVQQNSDDMVKKGRQNRDHNCHTSKLTEDQARQIKQLYKWHSREAGFVALGRRFGVSSSSIQAIVIGKSWKHL